MKKYFYSLSLVLFLLVVSESKAQNEVYWREGFEPFTDGVIPACDLSTTNPSAAVSYFFNGNAGTWYGVNLYRTTGTGCPAGNPHVRFRNISGVTDSGYLVTPVVNFGINEFHFLRGRATRSHTIWATTDTSALTTNWIVVGVAPSSAATVTCVDTAIIINNASYKRLKITSRPGTDTDVDSFYMTSVNAIAPVKFGNVNASLVNGFVKLNWDILLEVNTQAYYIESSVDGRNFNYVGSLSASNSSKYSYVTNLTNASGNSYYRIKAVDKDGAVTYSNVLRLNTKKTDVEVNINPNPVKDGIINLQLSNFTKAAYALNLFDANGKKVFTKSIAIENGLTSQAVEVGNTIAKGIYQLQVTNGNTNVIKTIMIQ